MAKATKPKPAKAASQGTRKKPSAKAKQRPAAAPLRRTGASSSRQGGKTGAKSAKASAAKTTKAVVNGAKATGPVRKPVKFDRKTLTAIKTSLVEMRSELERELKDLEEASLNVTQSEMSGEVGYDEDYADAGSFTFEREKDLSIANNVQDLLDKISRSLGKIEEGTYGTCESCGQAIEAARLKALPHALLCVRCKTAEERR